MKDVNRKQPAAETSVSRQEPEEEELLWEIPAEDSPENDPQDRLLAIHALRVKSRRAMWEEQKQAEARAREAIRRRKEEASHRLDWLFDPLLDADDELAFPE